MLYYFLARKMVEDEVGSILYPGWDESIRTSGN